LLAITFAGNSCLAAEPLKGTVEEGVVMPSRDVLPKAIEPMPIPVFKPKLAPQQGAIDSNKLQGAAEDTALKGRAEDSGNGKLMPGVPGKEDDVLKGRAEDSGNSKLMPAMPAKVDKANAPLSGKVDAKNTPLQASASKDDGPDPDEEDQLLMVEWDRWRNRFLWSVQSGIQEILDNPTEATLRWDERKQAMVSKFPLGTMAWFSCQITPDKQIVNLKLMRSSGYPGYDDAVLESVRALQGSSILRYPPRSKRRIVTQVAGVKTADTGEYKYFKFGDVEHQRRTVGR